MSAIWQYLTDHWSTILDWFGWHAWLSAAPVLIGLVIALPLGWLAHRSALVKPVLLTAAGLLYTIPSLALFVLLPGLLGTKILDPVNVLVALTLYTVSLLVRVVTDGLESVPREVVQAATAMGFTGWQRVLRVELPLAVPVIVAGLRVAAVSNVSITSIAALLGIPQLGQLFTAGFQLFSTEPIVIGIAGCVLIAVVYDTLIVLGGSALTPWLRAVRRS